MCNSTRPYSSITRLLPRSLIAQIAHATGVLTVARKELRTIPARLNDPKRISIHGVVAAQVARLT